MGFFKVITHELTSAETDAKIRLGAAKFVPVFTAIIYVLLVSMMWEMRQRVPWHFWVAVGLWGASLVFRLIRGTWSRYYDPRP